MFYALLADFIVVFHLAYVLFVIVGLFLILLGILFRWRWIRNFWFRLIHFVMIGVVAFEALAGITCPLTTWEGDLRRLAGQEAAEGTFVGRLASNILFYDVEPGNEYIFTICYVSFAIVILGALIVAPPRLPSWLRRS